MTGRTGEAPAARARARETAAGSAAKAPGSGVLVLGIGNLLMGDEGVGVHVANALQSESLPPGVTVLDGGTGGLHLLSWLTAFSRVVVVDATADGRPAGTVDVRHPRFARDFPPALGAHDLGLKELIDAATALERLPRMALVTISVALPLATGLELSAPVRQALPRAAQAVRGVLADWAGAG